MSWHLFSPAVLAEQLLPPTTAPSYDLLILLPAIALISFVAAGFGLWAFRRIRDQHARAELLAEDLFRIREETRRRLNFLNAISHDLRTPLNGITLQTHIIDRAIDADCRSTGTRSNHAGIRSDALGNWVARFGRAITVTHAGVRGQNIAYVASAPNRAPSGCPAGLVSTPPMYSTSAGRISAASP